MLSLDLPLSRAATDAILFTHFAIRTELVKTADNSIIQEQLNQKIYECETLQGEAKSLKQQLSDSPNPSRILSISGGVEINKEIVSLNDIGSEKLLLLAQMQTLVVSVGYSIYDPVISQFDKKYSLDNTIHQLVCIIRLRAGLTYLKVLFLLLYSFFFMNLSWLFLGHFLGIILFVSCNECNVVWVRDGGSIVPLTFCSHI